LCNKFSPVRILHISQVNRALLCGVSVVLYALFDGIAWVVILSGLCGVLTSQSIMAGQVLIPHVFQRYSYTKLFPTPKSPTNQAGSRALGSGAVAGGLRRH